MNYVRAGLEAMVGHEVTVAGARVRVPGRRTIRLAAVFGNRRIHRLMDSCLAVGATIVDAGAHIGINTVYAARRVGPRGRVLAVEPTPDSLAVLRTNVAGNRLDNVIIAPVAAGRARERREFFLRGETSAVNSFHQDGLYAEVTGVVTVPVEPLDALVEGDADLVKIDVEGAELDVLGGMTRLLRWPRLRLVVEWHPLLQQKAGYSPDALPLALLDLGFALQGASHLRVTPVVREDLTRLADKLMRSGRPVDLLAARSI